MSRRVYLSPPHTTARDRELLLDAFDSNWIAPLGPHVDAFENEMCETTGVSHAAALSSGTAALHLSLLLSDVGPGDKVICSSFTFAATANAITYCGAEPVFVDSEWSTWNLDPDLLQRAVHALQAEGTPPKAIISVDLYGQVASYETIEPICVAAGVPLIEDAAEALGSSHRGRSAGTFGRMAALSFNGNKIITTSGGGMLLSEDEGLIRRARFLATQARDDAPHYQHSTVGYNYRMSNLLAALGRGQLATLPMRVDARRANFAAYHKELSDLPGVGFMPEPADSVSNRWLTCLTFDPDEFGASREDVRSALEARNIESRPLWKPMHLQPVFEKCRMFGGAVSATLFERGLCIPSGSDLLPEDRNRVIEIIRSLAATGSRKRTQTGALT